MEYAALGIPAIVTRTSAVEAYFTDEMVSFVEPEDPAGLAAAIITLADDPDRREALAVRAQSFSTEHRWPDEAERYVALVEGLVRPRHG
jgi:glycosyltransferase involved in cell wall biosynthesis